MGEMMSARMNARTKAAPMLDTLVRVEVDRSGQAHCGWCDLKIAKGDARVVRHVHARSLFLRCFVACHPFAGDSRPQALAGAAHAPSRQGRVQPQQR